MAEARSELLMDGSSPVGRIDRDLQQDELGNWRLEELLSLRTFAPGRHRRMERELQTIESPTGQALQFRWRHLTGELTTIGELRSSGKQVEMELQIGRRYSHRSLPLPPNWLLDHALGTAIESWLDSAQPELIYQRFDPVQLKFQMLSLQRPVPGSYATSVDATDVELIQVSIPRGSQPDQTMHFDRRSLRLRGPVSLLGHTFERRECASPCETALEAYDPLAEALVPSPFHIPDSALHGRIRYVLSQRDGSPPALPETGEQAVLPQRHRTVVTVCSECGTEQAPSATQLLLMQSANPWVQSTDPAIRKLLQDAKPGTGSVRERMQRLEDFVRSWMNGPIELEGYATAVTAARVRSGDCTEYAVLLAALARADGIPVRVVAGMSYASHFVGRGEVFGPHAWVQAWDGRRWRSFDAALGKFTATRLVLAIGDGTPDDYQQVLQRLSVLQIQTAGQLPALD